MSGRTHLLALAVLAGALLAAADAYGSLVFGNVSGWTVHTEPGDGYRCFAEAPYEGGTFLRIGFDSSDDSAVYLVFGNPAWAGISPGISYEFDLRFDDADAISVAGTASAESDGFRLVVPSATRQEFWDAFEKRHSVSIGRAGEEDLVLSLAGSRNALRMLEECKAAFSHVE